MSSTPGSPSGKDASWEAIFQKYRIDKHDFDVGPFSLSANQIKEGLPAFPAHQSKGGAHPVQAGHP